MADYITVDDRIIGKKVLYNDRQIGTVTGKLRDEGPRTGPEYVVELENGTKVYITDSSLWKFKMISE